MQRVTKVAQTLRNNWKKSIFGAVVVSYGIISAKERHQINTLMRAACEEAAQYGDAHIHRDQNPKVITVILNPVANKRAARTDYEKYCEPILHLAGLKVELVTTTSEGNAKEVAESLRGTEAIIVAGGDGTLSETVTGLLRRNDRANEFPLGVLPLGKTNSFGNKVFPSGKGILKIKQLINASMAIVKEHTEYKDVMKIEPMEADQEVQPRPIYALSSIEWGAFQETAKRKEKYWFFGPFRDYATYVFNGYKDNLPWNCSGTLKYTPPCIGCNNCVEKPRQIRSKWSFLLPVAPIQKSEDFSKIFNKECSKVEELCFKTSDLKVTTPNMETQTKTTPSLKMCLGKFKPSYVEFVSEGWKRVTSEPTPSKVIEARKFEIIPERGVNPNELITIDSEEFEVKPMKVTLISKAVKLYSSTEQ